MMLLTTVAFGALIQLALTYPADTEVAHRELSDDDRLETALKSLETRTDDDDRFESSESERGFEYRELPDDDSSDESEKSLKTRTNDDAQFESPESKRENEAEYRELPDDDQLEAVVKSLESEPSNSKRGVDSCPDGFTKTSAGFCFKIIRSKLAWNVAGMLCNSFDRKAHLAIIDSSAKQHAIQSVIYNVDACKQPNHAYGLLFWIGGQRIEPSWQSPFVWRALNANGQEDFIRSMSYTNWHNREPNYARSGESCLNIGGVGYGWNDDACDYPMCSICEA